MKGKTRRARLLRQWFLKAGVWIFLIIFVFSVVGVAMVIVR